jgi:hypothetical protein
MGMRPSRILFAWLLLVVVALAWNGFLHLVVLRHAREAVQHLIRPDFQRQAWLSVPLTAALIALFMWGYGRFVRDASVREAVRYGLFFGVVAGLLVDANQYLIYPIPAWVAGAWFAGGLIEFQLYALLLTRLWPPSHRVRPEDHDYQITSLLGPRA